MTIRRYSIEELTLITCKLNGAKYGIACNKTVFLIKENMQSNERLIWTAIHYENDRFGLLNGLLYLINESKEDYIEVYFAVTKERDCCILRLNKLMSFTEVSKIVDTFYTQDLVEYR